MKQEIRPTKPRVAFLIPMYGSMPIPAVQSLINLLSNAGRFCEPYLISAASAYINLNRNRCVQLFQDVDKKAHFDFAFWIDSDQAYSYMHCAKLLMHLVKDQRDIATGMYFTPMEGKPAAILGIKRKDIDGYRFPKFDEIQKSRKIDSAGFGFTCMKADVLRKVAEKNGEQVFRYRYTDDGRFIGEDHCFFEDAKELGHDLWLYPEITVGHAKVISYPMEPIGGEKNGKN